MILLTLVAAAPARAADPLKTLAAIRDFAFGGVGAAGITSQGELAFREVLRGPAAEAGFARLLTSGNPQARCYALVGLHGLNPGEFDSAVAHFLEDQTPVSTISGCMPAKQPMASVVANIKAGRYDSYLKKREVRKK